MRILYVITELDPGGAEKALHHLLARLDRARFGVEVACLSGDGEVGEWIEREGITVHRLHLCLCNAPLALWHLWRLVRQGRFDVVHTFLFHANVVGRIVARLGGARRVVSSVRVEEPRRWHQWLNRLTWRLADRIVCVSESTKRFFCERARVPAARAAVIPNGVDASRFKPREGPPTPVQDPVRVIAVGRLEPQKGYDVLVEAARMCAERDIVFEVAVAGEGPDREMLEGRVRDAGLAETFRLLGTRDDVPELFAAADLFMSASRWEGMPNVVLEAMAAGLPVVGTSVGGTPEVVVQGETGLLVQPDDPHALAAAMAELMLDPETRQEFGQRGRQRVLAEFTWERNAEAHMRLYDAWLSP